MEKKIVRNWDDLKKDKFINLIQEKCFGAYRICIDGNVLNDEEVEFETRRLDKAVKILNALGGNFEYIPVEIIDTFPKFREFLTKNKLAYKPFKECCIHVSERTQHFRIREAENRYNVKLKILQ